MAPHFDTVEEYIASFPPDVRAVLQEIRQRCHAAIPDSGETISYGIPTITLEGKHVLYFAGWAHHVSVYPVPVGGEAFRESIAPYREAKGTLKFVLGKRVPYELIGNVAALLAAERRGSTP